MVRAIAAVAAVFLVIYLPDIGHGFISDDFRWIVENRIQAPSEVMAPFSSNTGFYRPMTSLSFAADHAAWGTHALGYGVTNLALCLLAAAALFMVGRRLGLPAAPALLASSVWLLNFHAVNMAVLWLSGRTALLAAIFSLLTAYAMLSARYALAGILALLAMLSKEEAIALPALFAGFYVIVDRAGPAKAGLHATGPAVAGLHGTGPAVAGLDVTGRPEDGVHVESGFSRTFATTAPLWVAALVYLALRAQSGAFWPADAPSYYRFSFSPVLIARNILEYADRAGTAFTIVAILLVVAGRIRWADVSGAERRVLLFAAVWIAAMYGLTVFLPVRSSLYALLPSLGSALAVGAIASAAQRRNPSRIRKATVALIVIAVLLIPVYRSRNLRWVRLAELSDQAMRAVTTDVGERASGHVVMIDAPQERVNLVSAFGNLLPDALKLYVGSGWTGEIVTPPAEASQSPDREYRLENGTLRGSTPAAK
jgi:hypothetical protein